MKLLLDTHIGVATWSPAFRRLLAAQAVASDLILVSVDPAFRAFKGLRVLN